MKSFTVFLLLTLIICSIHNQCNAIPANKDASSNSQALQLPKPGDSSFNLSNIVQELLTEFYNLRDSALEDMNGVLHVMVNSLKLLLEPWIKLFELVMNAIRSLTSSVINNTLGRSKRSLSDLADLASSALTSAIHSPFETLQELTSNLIPEPNGSTESEVSGIWNLLITQVLPWAHRFLDDLEKTNKLPSNLTNLIKEFDSVYELLEHLGYITSSSA